MCWTSVLISWWHSLLHLLRLSWLLAKDSIYPWKRTPSWHRPMLYVSTSAAERFCHSPPKISLVNLNVYVCWFHTGEKRGNSMIYTFFPASLKHPTFHQQVVWQSGSVSVCVSVFVCMCTHLYVFGQGPIKPLMLAVFYHCEISKWISASPLAPTYE